MFCSFILLTSCDFLFNKNHLEVINNLNYDIIVEYNQYDKGKDSLGHYISYYLQQYGPLKKNKTRNISRLITEVSLEKYINESPSKMFILYVYNVDTLKNQDKLNKLGYLVEKKMFVKRMCFSIDSLDKLDWKIVID